jgi:hypothetical protein
MFYVHLIRDVYILNGLSGVPMPVVSFGVTVNIATGDNARIVVRTSLYSGSCANY